MSLCRKLNKNDILKLKAKINKDSFHIEITDEVLEIHIRDISHIIKNHNLGETLNE